MQLKPIFMILALAMMSIVVLSQGSGNSKIEKEIVALDQAWIDAEVKHDLAALEKILDPGFLITMSSGVTVNREAFIKRIMGAKINPFEVNHDSISVHGDTVVVIDSSIDRKTKYTWVAIKRKGSWRVISETVSTVAKG